MKFSKCRGHKALENEKKFQKIFHEGPRFRGTPRVNAQHLRFITKPLFKKSQSIGYVFDPVRVCTPRSPNRRKSGGQMKNFDA